MTRRCLGIAFSTAIALGAANFVYAEQSGLVNVDVSNLRTDIAKNIQVDVSQIPVNVQVPVGVAANVCGVDANALAQQKQGSQPSCQAKNQSQALNQQVQQQLAKK